jgi:hypothetical protein
MTLVTLKKLFLVLLMFSIIKQITRLSMLINNIDKRVIIFN